MEIETIGNLHLVTYYGGKGEPKKVIAGYDTGLLISRVIEDGEPVVNIDITTLPVGTELTLLEY